MQAESSSLVWSTFSLAVIWGQVLGGASAALYLLVMSMTPDLKRLPQTALAELARGSVDRKSPLRWFTLATMRGDGQPEARTVVLRAVDQDAARMTCFTDRRSAKVAEIADNPRVTCLFFDAKHMRQYRLNGEARILTSGPVWARHWQGLSERGKRDYAAITAPGTQGHQDADYNLDLAEQYFTVIEVSVDEMDWLSLASSGHRRARVTWSDGGSSSEAVWLTP